MKNINFYKHRQSTYEILRTKIEMHLLKLTDLYTISRDKLFFNSWCVYLSEITLIILIEFPLILFSIIP